MKATLFILAITGIALYASAKEFVSRLTFSIEKIQFNLTSSIVKGFRTLDFNVTVKLVNPTAFAITIKTFSFDFFYQGEKVGSVVQQQVFGNNLSIAARSEHSYNLALEVPLVSTVSAVQKLVQALSSGQQHVALDIKGAANSFLFGGIKFNTTYNVF